MHEFQCGHQECSSRLVSLDLNHLKSEMAEHLRVAHNVKIASETLVTYLLTTCVTTTSARPA